ALDLLHWRSRQRADERNAGVGDRDVDPAEALDGRADGILHRLEVGHVGLKPHRAIAQRGGVLLQALRLEAYERHVGPLTMQALGARLADPARGAGDERGAPADIVWGGSRAIHVGLRGLVTWRPAGRLSPKGDAAR